MPGPVAQRPPFGARAAKRRLTKPLGSHAGPVNRRLPPSTSLADRGPHKREREIARHLRQQAARTAKQD